MYRFFFNKKDKKYSLAIAPLISQLVQKNINETLIMMTGKQIVLVRVTTKVPPGNFLLILNDTYLVNWDKSL